MNDRIEKGVLLISSFDAASTNQEDQKQFLLQDSLKIIIKNI